MSEATCKTCRWWVETYERAGTCHKYAPAYAKQTVDGMFIWPSTHPDDWCGEHPARKEGAHDGQH